MKSEKCDGKLMRLLKCVPDGHVLKGDDCNKLCWKNWKKESLNECQFL